MNYEGAYNRLVRAILRSAPPEDRARLLCADVDKLCDYIESKTNAPTTLDGDAIAQHELMSSYTRAGFTRDEAMVLLLAALENAAKMHVATEMMKRHDDD